MSMTRLDSAPRATESTFINPLYGANPFKLGNSAPRPFALETARHKLVDFVQGPGTGRAQGTTRPGILRSPDAGQLKPATVTASRQGLRWRDERDLVQVRAYEPEGGFDESTSWKPHNERSHKNFWDIKRPDVREKLLQVDSRFSRNPHLVYAQDSKPPLEDLAAWLLNLGRE